MSCDKNRCTQGFEERILLEWFYNTDFRHPYITLVKKDFVCI